MIRQIRIFFLAAFLAAGLSGIANAAIVIDQFQPNTEANMATFLLGQDLAQSFIQSENNIAGAGIFLMDHPYAEASDTITISLWSNLPTSGGSVIASGSSIGYKGAWVDVFWNPVSVVADTTLYLVFESENDYEYFGIRGSTNNPYEDGMDFWGEGFQPQPDYDYAFRTYFDDTQVPLPGSAAVLLIGLTAFAAASRRKH